jgi:hypothetical protein
MKQLTFLLAALATLGGVVPFRAPASGQMIMLTTYPIAMANQEGPPCGSGRYPLYPRRPAPCSAGSSRKGCRILG